jgi:hypothetical protein
MSERWIWTQKEDIGPSPRVAHAMAYEAARERVVLFGGEDGSNTWEWDGVAWTQVADMGPSPRYACAMTYDTVRQRVVLFGGSSTTNGTALFSMTCGNGGERNGSRSPTPVPLNDKPL